MLVVASELAKTAVKSGTKLVAATVVGAALSVGGVAYAATPADIDGGTIDNATITGGTINNATIGGSSSIEPPATSRRRER